MIELQVIKGENHLQVGNLVGATTWCAMCQEQTDHNASWHLEREME